MFKQSIMKLKQPLKTFTSTTRFGYVPNGKNKRFQYHRCKDACSE